MRIFLLKSLILSCMVLSIYALAASHYKPVLDPRNDYMAAIMDKHDRLERVGTRRLLLVGGSSLAFGINSERMQNELGLTVTNMGLHAGLGSRFILKEAGSAVKSGDTVVISFEYELYDSETVDLELIEHTQLIYPESQSWYGFSLRESCLLSFKHFRKSFDKAGSISTDPIYNRMGFNTFGDMIAHIQEPGTMRTYHQKTMNRIVLDAASVRAFHDFAAKCNSVGARLYLTYPNFPRSLYRLNMVAIKDFETQVRNKLDFVTTIGDSETFVLDDSSFFDTNYHLGGAGREQRTAILIAKLRAGLPSCGP